MRIRCLLLSMMSAFHLFASVQEDFPADRLPERFMSYRITDRLNYTGEDLYDYINGGAELYLSYGLTRMTGCKYNGDGIPQLTVEIYEMTTSKNAFGVYTQSRDREERVYGQGSQSFHDFILFWKGCYFVTVYAQSVTPESEAAIKHLAEVIDKAIPATGQRPPVVDLLPEEGLAEGGFLYFHHYIWLNAYFFIANHNLIDLDDQTDAVLAKYGDANARNYLLIVEYPDGEKAASACQKLKENYAPELTAAQMLDEAVTTLTGKKDAREAWASIVKPTDIVGVKTNVWNKFPTPEIMNTLLKERALQAGVSDENLSVNDRGVKDDPIFQKSTALINVRPMRTHAWSGVGSCIKNYIMFSPQPSSYHDDSCASLATLYDLPIVKGKTRLHILVLFKPLFHHRTAQDASEEYMWKYSGLIAGFDPVAVDSVGLRIIQGKRNAFFQEDRPLNPPAKHIELAETRYHLGVADPSKIELVKLGWDEETFV